MRNQADLDRCLSFINCQLQPQAETAAAIEAMPKCAVTISRQSGSGARAIADRVAVLLRSRAPKDAPPWTVFDRNLVERVLEDHQLPERLARFMPEDRVSGLDDIMDELFGLHPSTWTLAEQTAETILHLAELGNVIVLGRGANVITAKLPHVVHVRIVGSPERRADNLARTEGITRREAAARIRREDLGRRRYLKKYFKKDIDDPTLYHLVINTDFVPVATAAALIANLTERCARD